MKTAKKTAKNKLKEPPEYMEIAVTLMAVLTVPKGSVLSGERGVILPSGQVWKLWPTIEEDETRDLTGLEIEEAGGFLEHGDASMEVL